MVTSVVTEFSKIVAGKVSAAIGLHRFLIVAGIVTASAATVLWLAVSPVRPLDGRSNADPDGPAAAD